MLKMWFKNPLIQAHTYKFNSIPFCRTTSPLSSESTLRAANATQTFQLWASVSSALCGCVNNPQNGNVICLLVNIDALAIPVTTFKSKQRIPHEVNICSKILILNMCLPEEGQRICVAAFAIIKVWLQQIVLPRPEIFQPICSFIAMTVANNCKWHGQNGSFFNCVFFWKTA